MPTLRPYQADGIYQIELAWYHGANTVLYVLPTGGGKTVVFSEVVRKEPRPSCAIAHRKEIITQISLALARNGVRHRIIGQDKTVTACRRLHLRHLQRSYVDQNARCAVASVDTLVNIKPTDPEHAWLATVALWVGDEGHHFLRANKWGRAVAMFSNARGLLVTATPCRADGHGLGRHASGMADAMVIGPSMRDLINMGYLVGYRVACPEPDVNIAGVELGADGDFKQNQLRNAFHASGKHCGNVVTAYETHARGLKTVVFSVDVEEAQKAAAEFNARGIPAAVVSAETEDGIRNDRMRRFETGELKVLCNVDLFGEGYDLPNLVCVILDRHTESFSLYSQQWGRGARLDIDPALMAKWDTFTDAERLAHIAASPKPWMFVIDLVGNFIRHDGPPDRPQVWTLSSRERRTSNAVSDAIPYRVCANKNANNTGIPCDKPYERFRLTCPYCGHRHEPPGRSAPEYVEGNVWELDETTLARLRGEIAVIDQPASMVKVPGMGYVIDQAARNRHHERQRAQERLRNTIAWYGGYLEALGVVDRGELQSRFYYAFGIDIGTARTLGTKDAEALRERVDGYLSKYGIDGSVISGIN